MNELTNDEARLGYLDGLRGFAALWVLTGHLTHVFHLNIPVISTPGLAVDLFMILSGFLMYYHARLREGREPMERPASWLTFWTRRFFRLAPVYYVALVAAFILGPMILPSVQLLNAPHDADAFLDQSWTNMWMHLTFLFGFVPEYVQRTVVFDWSLALEMQFYAAFPFIFWFMRKMAPMKICFALVVFAMLFRVFAGDYLAAFGQPAFLLMKINLFLAGMIIGAAFFDQNHEKSFSLVMAAMVLAALPLAYPFGVPSTVLRLAFVAMVAGLALHHRYPLPALLQNSIALLDKFLSNMLSRFLSDTSYAVYLIHPMILFPIAAWMVTRFSDVPAPLLFLAGFAVITPLTYGIAFLLHHAVEQPGIAWGKSLIRTFRPKTLAA